MTSPPSTLEKLCASLALHPLVHAVAAEAAGTVRVTAGSMSRLWQLRLVPDALTGLPDVRLIDDPLIGRLAHVNYEGTVCVTDKVGISVDWTRPEAVAGQLITDTLAELETSLHKEQRGEFDDLLEEFEGYWFSLPRRLSVDLHLPLDTTLREVAAHVSIGRQCVAFTERRGEKKPPYGGLRRYQGLPVERALYIPLDLATLPPNPSQPLHVERLRHWVRQGLGAPTRAALEKALRSWPRRVSSAYVLFSQPRPSGPRAAFGVQLLGPAARHPLLDSGSQWRTRPLHLRRHTAQDLIPRGGASAALATRRVAVIGCGAVGSRVAEHLALSGVRGLHLIDPESLDPDNLYRHVLGGEFCGVAKALALKAYLQRRLPELAVEPLVTTIDAWMTRANLAQVDGIVLATGVPHLERAFIQQTRGWQELHGPLVTTWLEPLGLGGHAQLTLPGVAGCLECLYTDTEGGPRLSPKVGFVVPGQAISRNLTGCAGGFTPFSALDATQTALLATRQLTSALTGVPTPSYACWKGSDAPFRAAGFRTSPWYDNLDGATIAQAAEAYSRVPCAVCGGRT